MQFITATAKSFRDMVKKENKYHAKKTTVNGITFDSKWEAERYNQLSAMEQSGQIKNLQRQVRFVLQDGYINNKGKKIKPIYYFADFQYTDKDGNKIVEDTKSPATKTDVYKLKKKLFEAKFTDYIFVEMDKK